MWTEPHVARSILSRCDKFCSPFWYPVVNLQADLMPLDLNVSVDGAFWSWVSMAFSWCFACKAESLKVRLKLPAGCQLSSGRLWGSSCTRSIPLRDIEVTSLIFSAGGEGALALHVWSTPFRVGLGTTTKQPRSGKPLGGSPT